MIAADVGAWIAVVLVIIGGIGAGLGTLYSSRKKGERDGMGAALLELDVMTRKADRLQGEKDSLERQLRVITKERDTLEGVIARALKNLGGDFDAG
jgi:hypothetical protein